MCALTKISVCFGFLDLNPSVLEVRRDERQSVDQQCKRLISGWLEFGSDRGSNDETLL